MARPVRYAAKFRRAEFACHDGTAVPKSHDQLYLDLCRRILQPLRARFGVCQVLSGYRTVAWNAQVGGADRSAHIGPPLVEAVAADVRFARGRVADWAAAADELGAGGLGTYRGFIHVDNRAGPPARWSG